jgi:hypothetical protein
VSLGSRSGSVPLGSRSGSVPRSSSVASGSSVGSSNAPAMSDLSENIGGPSKLSKEDKALLLEYLGIDTELPSLGPPGLRSAYQKFKAITNATPKVMGLAKDAEWKAQFNDTRPWLPTIVNFIDIFVAKSQFYQMWKPTFLRAQEYPVMKDWLNQHKDRLSTKDLWSVEAQHTLTFADLKKWLEEKDREADIKQDVKGKRKAPQSPPKLKKKKHDDRDRGVQRKHKKSKTSMEPDRESE